MPVQQPHQVASWIWPGDKGYCLTHQRPKDSCDAIEEERERIASEVAKLPRHTDPDAAEWLYWKVLGVVWEDRRILDFCSMCGVTFVAPHQKEMHIDLVHSPRPPSRPSPTKSTK